MPVFVSQLAIAPVKGMRLQCTSEVWLGRHEVTGDREFLVIGGDGQLLLASRIPALLQIEPAWDRVRNVLTLGLPGGDVVQDTPEPGAPATVRMYDGREIPGWIIPGHLAPRCLASQVGRCNCSKRNPESGATDARILHALARLRGKNDITFGVWCEILRPGRIQVGDAVMPRPRS